MELVPGSIRLEALITEGAHATRYGDDGKRRFAAARHFVAEFAHFVSEQSRYDDPAQAADGT